ncbi:MAG: hypothetical protein LUC44_00645 [Prevotellaceae bacterium]|nr:hypothetical protein [Prevotellaceae bacterium]
MKSRTLSLAVACLMGIAAYAQWTAPEQPTAAGELVSGHSYQIRNADAGDLYLAGGTSWYTWATSLILVERSDASTPITYTISYEEGDEAMNTGWTLVNSSTEEYTFISGTIDSDDAVLSLYNGLGELHVDMAAQGHNYFDITETDATNHYYQIQVISADTLYGETSGCLGYIKTDENYPSAVYAFLDPSDSDNGCKWELVDCTEYIARLNLYDALVESTNYSTMDATVVSSATNVYNNASATIEELDAATLAVKTARNDAIMQGATQANPADVTMLIDNNDFSTGSISGWDCTFVSGSTATNVGYQSASYTNTSYTYVNHNDEEVNPNVNQFIEAWSESGAQYGSTDVSRSIGDAELSQTMKELPAGNYRLAADVIAVNQDDASLTVTGTQLFATSADFDMYTEISTANETPEHITLLFASDGGDVTIGLRTQNTNANWIAADNFELTYYGNESSAYYFILEETINTYEEAYPELSEVYANNEVKAAYEEAMANAQSLLSNGGSDDEYQAAADALSEAGSTLDTSVSEYATVAAKIEYVLSLESQSQENGWDGLVDNLSEYREGTLEPGYYDGTLTSDEIAEISDTISNMLADYISQNVQAGQDVSILIQNNDFDTDFSGWDVDESGATPAWGGSTSLQGENTIEGGILVADIASGCAEVYWAAFDISQTIKNMPEGLYTLSCQAFERDDASNGIDAELYAQLEGEDEQTQKVMDIYTDGSAEQLYGCGEWYDDSAVTLSDGTSGYIPNGMNGADVYFYAGHYYNSMQVLVVERGDLKIGIRNTNATDWVLFDTFRLVYEGNDASVYKDYIQNLIDEANTLGDDGVLTAEAESMINAAIIQGEDAMGGSDGETCIAAIEALREAISFGNTSISLVSDLETLYNYITEVSMSEIESSESTYDGLLDEVSSALDDGEFETNAAVEQYMLDLKKGLTAYAQYDFLNATEDNPADLTAVILTHDGVDVNGDGSTLGWDIDGSVGLGNGCVEMYNLDAGNTMSQTIYGLAAGYYRLGVQGFYRATAYADVVDANDVDTLAYNADLFAGEAATRLCSIKSDAEAYNTLVGGTTSGSWSIPTSMETANTAFENGLYNNILQFQVTEDEDEVVIGITKTGLIADDWTIYDNWTLTYLGTTEPSEDATTAIESAEAAGTAVATAIYSVDGKQLSSLAKGINIVKTTMADGSVKVNKILVK